MIINSCESREVGTLTIYIIVIASGFDFQSACQVLIGMMMNLHVTPAQQEHIDLQGTSNVLPAQRGQQLSRTVDPQFVTVPVSEQLMLINICHAKSPTHLVSCEAFNNGLVLSIDVYFQNTLIWLLLALKASL